MDDLSNRETAQEAGEALSPEQRDELKHCLDDLVALINGRLLDGTKGTAGQRAPKP